MSPQITPYFDDLLAGKQSESQVREVLLLIDPSGALVNDFAAALKAIQLKIPGLGIDYEKLLASDPIECDPLVSQGSLALLRLNTIYYQAYEAWTKSGGDLHRYKRITKADSPATYSDRAEKHERTDQNYPPDAQLLNQVVNITLSAFRVQATITHRREQLSAQRLARSASEGTASSSDPEFLLRASASSGETESDVISAEESLADAIDAIDVIETYESDLPRINAIYKLRKINGYNHLDPAANESSTKSSSHSAPPRETKIQVDTVPLSNINSAENHSSEIRKENAVTENITNQALRSNPHAAISAPPRETNQFTNNKPHFHKRE